ncbi:MAG: beta-lactamase family protein [Alphaproteobacteria bacterium]|nr:beta-lactamase family protein [Alphaproteobacteria bacterium]
MIRRILLLTVLALLGWTALVVTGTLEGWWRQPLAPFGDTTAFRTAAIADIDKKHKGNVAFALLENGQVIATHFVSIGKPVDGDSRFQVASMSKWITAWGVMTLVEAGKLDLDKPVSLYLKRWKLPASKFDNNGVTVRRLLSHTAGLTDGLGYAGFKPGDPVQALEASLTRAADATPGRDGAVRVGIEPGTEFKYSGGGYTLLQLLVEEVSGQSFNKYMTTSIFAPLGMTRSTFVLEDGAMDVTEFFDERGAPATHYRFAALAAASLYTTTNDMTRFLQAHLAGPRGEAPGRGVLGPKTLLEMRRPHASQYGADIWGLGTMLFVPNNTGSFVIGHDGNNEPAINTAARLDPATGNGIIVLETGNRLLATPLASEWVFWDTGNVDFLMLVIESGALLKTLAVGCAAIILAALAFGWRLRRRPG